MVSIHVVALEEGVAIIGLSYGSVLHLEAQQLIMEWDEASFRYVL